MMTLSNAYIFDYGNRHQSINPVSNPQWCKDRDHAMIGEFALGSCDEETRPSLWGKQVQNALRDVNDSGVKALYCTMLDRINDDDGTTIGDFLLK